MIKSPEVLRKVVSHSDLRQFTEIQSATSPIDFVRNRLAVVCVGGSDVYRIDYETESMESAHIVVNTVTKLFVEQRFEDSYFAGSFNNKQRMGEVAAQLKRENLLRQHDLAEMQERLMTVASRLTYVGGLIGQAPQRPPPKPSITDSLNELNINLGENEFSRLRLAAIREVHQQVLKDQDLIRLTGFDRALAVERNRQVTRLGLLRWSTMLQMDKLRARGFDDEHEPMKKLWTEIASLDKSLAKIRLKVPELAIQEYVRRTTESEGQRILDIDGQLERLESAAIQLRHEIAAKQDVLAKMYDKDELEFAFALRDVERMNNITSLIDDNIQHSEVEPLVRIEVPRLPSADQVTVSAWENPRQRLLLACTVAFILPFIGAAVFSRAYRVRDSPVE